MNTGKAEALFQFNCAKKHGIKKVIWSDNKQEMITFYNNGVVVINNFNSLKVQFELEGKLCSVSIR